MAGRSVVLTCGLVGALAATTTACRKPEPPPSPIADAGVEGSASAADGGVPVLTAEQVDAYARYQKAMVAVYDGLFRDLERLGAAAARDAGATGVPAAVAVVEARAKAEDEARRQAGLSEAELAWIEPLVIDVISARSLARSLDSTAQIADLEAMRGPLEGDVREGLDQTVEDLKRQQEEGLRLSEQRAKYGDANVDRVLGREAELTRNYEQWLSRMTGGRR